MASSHRVLDITLQKAKDLNAASLFNCAEVCAEVTISGRDKPANPKILAWATIGQDAASLTWNIPTKFTVGEEEVRMNCLVLDLKLVCLRNQSDEVEEIGQVNVPIAKLYESETKGERMTSFPVRKPDGKHEGQIYFTYKFTIADAPTAPPMMGSGLFYPPPVPSTNVSAPNHRSVPPYSTGYNSAYPYVVVYPPHLPPPLGVYHQYPPPPDGVYHQTPPHYSSYNMHPQPWYSHPPQPPPHYGNYPAMWPSYTPLPPRPVAGAATAGSILGLGLATGLLARVFASETIANIIQGGSLGNS